MYNRPEVISQICSNLQTEYVALLEQWGTGAEAIINTITGNECTPIGDMRFISIALPTNVANDDDFILILLTRLQQAVVNIPPTPVLSENVKKIMEDTRVGAYSRLRLALDKLDTETATAPLIIVLQSFAKTSEKPLKNLLSMLREYHPQRNNHGQPGAKLRFLVTGADRLWRLCYHKTPNRSPFNIAQRVLLSGLSYKEIQEAYTKDNLEEAIKLRDLTGGVSTLVEQVLNKEIASDNVTPFFGHLVDNWQSLPIDSKDVLKRLANGKVNFPPYTPDHKCPHIPEIESPWMEAFWSGFLRMKYREITWRSPIHLAFVMERSGKQASRSDLIKADLLRRVKCLKKALANGICDEYRNECLEEALSLSVHAGITELVPFLQMLNSGERRDVVLEEIKTMLSNSKVTWLNELSKKDTSQSDITALLIDVVIQRASTNSFKKQISNQEPSSLPHTSVKNTQPPWVGFKLQVANLTGVEFEVRADSVIGQPKGTGSLPCDTNGLIAILKALCIEKYNPEKFSETQNNVLKKLNLLHCSRYVSEIHHEIGYKLYQALFPGDVGSNFKTALFQAREQSGAVNLQLRLDDDAVDLARYPWELINDGNRPLLSSGVVELTRYITYSEPPTSLKVYPPWHLLYITARPKSKDNNSLPLNDEREIVSKSLQPLREKGLLKVHDLLPPTYDNLLKELDANQYHIIHFDGHGVFAKKCPGCETKNYAHVSECVDCKDTLDDVQPKGYLNFEGNEKQIDSVNSAALESVLFNNQIRLAVISACDSATVRGESIFSGVGQSLIRSGIPAVIAMQLPIKTESAIRFCEGFYTSLTQYDSISHAVAKGRRRLCREQAYFIPTLYLRSKDDEGRLFIA
ncbi:MAG: CHAT domain-containing protein [Desulfobacterales bacterium]|nr:CHAT domain-containing protein [Desulfobacterales bacterium]